MEKKTWGRVIMGLLAGGAVLGIIGFPHGATPADFGKTEKQALQRGAVDDIVQQAVQRTPAMIGDDRAAGPQAHRADKSLALAPSQPNLSLAVALNAWYDSAPSALNRSLGAVAATPGGNGPDRSLNVAAQPEKSLGPVAATPHKSLGPVAGLIGHTIDGITPWILS
jgi:hypothetical protein